MDIEMKVVFVTPYFNAFENLENLLGSLRSQTDGRWEICVTNDMSTDGRDQELLDIFSSCRMTDNLNLHYYSNDEKKYALRNVVEMSRRYQNDDDVIIAILDADDQLCNDRTVEMIISSYENNGWDAVWTAHRWDINNLNISGPLDKDKDPYQIPWVSSHLKTFKSNILKKITDDNFLDHQGNWFKRGYDQILYLPILRVAKGNFHFLPEVCYQYNIDSVSLSEASRDKNERDQIGAINFVRARGFISR